MFGSVCVSAALLALLVLTLEAPGGKACPRSCNCYQASEVHCTFRSLLTIPPGLPAHTRRINLGFNSISTIPDSSLAGLKSVELLMLHSNDLHHLPDAAFRDMKSLQILKLSYNKLREIPSFLTFSGLTSLLRLYLDHNLLRYIHPRALLQLPSLRLLRLQGNRLHQLHPHALCTLSFLNTYYFSTLRHLDLSNNSLTTLPRATLQTAPLLETLVLQANPWSCDCRMNWLLPWSLAHPGLMKCPSGPMCPICATPSSLQGQGLLEQKELSCTVPVIPSPGRDTPLETELGEIQPSDSFRDPLGTASLGLSDDQGNSVNLNCNITPSTDSQYISPPPDLSISSSSPLPLALSLFLECPVDRESYEILWRILAYYSETAVRLEREIMLSKAPMLAYRYRQIAVTGGYYHTGVKASVKVRPQWLLQPAISIQLNRAQSNAQRVHLIYSTRVSTHPDPTGPPSTSSPASHPWVLISTNRTTTALAAVAGTKVELPCPLLTSGNSRVNWILPDGSKLVSPSSSQDGRLRASASGLLIQKVELSNAGIYYCIAQAGRDMDVLSLRLAVEESSIPPSGEKLAPTVTGTVGEPVSLTCEASGSPTPYMSWVLPDGNIVRRGIAVSGGVTIQSNGSLSLLKPTFRDAGYYRCIAVNQYGSDSLTMQLEINTRNALPLRTPFPKGPQSAAGRSTKIRAPLLGQEEEEGSGSEEVEEERTVAINRKRLRPLQPPPGRRYPNGKPRRRGPVREGALRRGGRPVSSTEQKGNHYDNRHRVTLNKQRIDPLKWADILAKIRQKTASTNNSQPVTAGTTTAGPVGGGKGGDTGRQEGDDNKERGVEEEEGMETETEGSTVDDAALQEEGLQPIYPVHKQSQTQTDSETDSESDKEIESSTKIQTELENETGTQIEAKTETVTNPETQTYPVTSKPVTRTNEIVSTVSTVEEQEANPPPSRSRPQNPRQGLFPNLVPNSRLQNPGNTRRRIGQRRRIINRPRGRPLTTPRPLPDPPNSRPKTVTSATATDQMNVLFLASTTTSAATLSTQSDHIKTLSTTSGAILDPMSPFVPNTPGISTLESTSPSQTPSSTVTLSPTHTKTHIDITTHSVNTPDTAESLLFNTRMPASTHSNIVTTHMPDVHTGTLSIDSHATPEKDVDVPPRKHIEELQKNVLDIYESQSYTTHSVVPSTSLATSHDAHSTTKNIYTTEATDDALLTTPTVIPTTINLITSTTTSTITPTYSTTRSTTTPTSTTTTTRPSLTSTAPTTTSTTTTTTMPSSTTFTTTTIASSTTISIKAIPTTPTPTTTTSTTTKTTTPTPSTTTTTTPSTTTTPTPSTTTTTTPSTTTTPTPSTTTTTTPSTTTTPTPSTTTTPTPSTTTTPTPSTTTTISEKTPSATTRADRAYTHPAIIMTSTSIRASSREGTNIDSRTRRPVSGPPNQSLPPTDWKNPAANSIPDSHSSRPQRPPSPSLPAVPRAPVVRSRPRISDPHIRTVSSLAESTARLDCEAQGEPKPSITWTKVATGAVMSIHSRAQRFEVLPNGTLVIQNVQLQDRGTYICSAHNVLGRDRLLSTLEVRTRPPRMQIVSYRETTIHQGGEVHLECQADGVPAPLLSWVLPDRSFLTSTSPSSSRISMDKNGTLHISVTLPSDRGVYRCVASNSGGAASASVRVHVSSLPPVIQQPREEHLILSPGMPVYAHCSARGAPPPALRWLIPDGTLVRPSQFLHGNLFVLPNGTLHIRKVGVKDSGKYQCTVSNAVGADKRILKVEVKGGAEEERREGGATNGGANTVAVEKTSLLKDKILSNPSFPSKLFNFAKLSPPLSSNKPRTLPATPSPSHQGISTNSPTKINRPATVSPSHSTNFNRTKLSPVSPPSTVSANNTKVLPGIANNTRVSSSPPNDKSRAFNSLPVSPFSKARIVFTSPSLTTVHYGDNLQLHCTVTGNPSPIIIWRTPSRKLVDMHFSFDRRMKVYPNGTLSVQAVTEKDAGDYLCITRNKVSDDYRLLRVSVVTKPAKIVPKQPFNQMVSIGKPLKMDCLASGLPDPAVRWSLPDGTMVNSVLQGEDRGGRALRPTVFNNGTLLVPAVGMGEEGEYTCYAENQGGQDTMKVKVKVMMTSPPIFIDDRSYRVIKVRQGGTATIRCRAIGDSAPMVTWFSPAQRVIPRSSGSGFYFERVVVVSDGTLEVRQAQKIDTGNYTCRAANSAGEGYMVVGLEVEVPNHGQVGGRGWSTGNGPGSDHRSRSVDNANNAGISQYDLNNGFASKPTSNTSSSNGNGKIRNTVPSNGINIATNGFNPDTQNRFNRPLSGITTQFGSVIGVGVSETRNVGVKADNIGVYINGPGVLNSGVRGDSIEKNLETSNNEVTARKVDDRSSSTDIGTISGNPRNLGGFSGRVPNYGAAGGNGFSRSINTGVSSDTTMNSGGLSNRAATNSTKTIVGVVTTVKQQVVKGQNVLLPCPSTGSPPPRLAWLLPGNGVLPAPYYGSRLTVHRNGSLELRGIRMSDGGTLVCVVRGERGETRIQVELEVSDPQEEARHVQKNPVSLEGLQSGTSLASPRGTAVERPLQKSPVSLEGPHSGALVVSHREPASERPVQESPLSFEGPRTGTSLTSAQARSVLPETLHQRIPVTQKPSQRGLSLPRSLGATPRSSGPVLDPVVSTQTASLVSTINGETLRLPCPAPQTPGYTRGSLSWTLPSGKVVTRGDGSNYLVQEDGTLIVQQASVFDRGTYTCRTTSSDSSLVSVIMVPVIVIAYPPRITKGPSPVTYTRPGVAVELPCLTIATPRATVTWEAPDLTQLRVMSQARIYGNRYLSPQGSLVIQNPTSRDTGFYRCTAKNVIGVDTKATYVHVI